MNRNMLNILKLLLMILFISGCCTFQPEADYEFLKRKIVEEIIKNPDDYINIIKKSRIKVKNQELLEKIPEFSFEDPGIVSIERTKLNELFHHSKAVYIDNDEKLWVLNGGGIQHCFYIKCTYRDGNYNIIKVIFEFKGGIWYLSSISPPYQD